MAGINMKEFFSARSIAGPVYMIGIYRKEKFPLV
jgi:hypothetical protein